MLLLGAVRPERSFVRSFGGKEHAGCAPLVGLTASKICVNVTFDALVLMWCEDQAHAFIALKISDDLVNYFSTS